MDSAAREFVRQRAGNRCEYCLLPEESDEWPFHVEHVIAKQHEGSDDLENLCWSCSRCNLHKGPNIASLDGETGDLYELCHPRKQLWNEHFTIRDARIVGLTSIGRVTARLLNMNDAHRVDLRRDLIGRGIIQA
jgi:HNH endonuclease